MSNPQNAPRAGQIYRHYKGGLYRVWAIALCERTVKPMVIYQSVDSVRRVLWVRLLSGWNREPSPGVRRYTLVEDAPEKDKESRT